VRALMAEVIAAAPAGELDYVDVVDPDTLVPLDVAGPRARRFGAVRFGRARLIDNLAVDDGAVGDGAVGDPGVDGERS
jgi:pantothenate synthetase